MIIATTMETAGGGNMKEIMELVMQTYLLL